MKRSSIVWIIIAGCLTLAGIIIFIAAMALNHWKFTSFGTKDFVEVTVEINDDFQNISVFSDTEDISFVTSDNSICKVVFFEEETKTFDAVVEGGTLYIKTRESGKWYEHISFFSTATPSITVYLPKEEYSSLSVEESTGDIDVPGDFRFETIALSSSTGDLSCRASSSGLLNIATSTGSITAEDLSAGDINLAVSTGAVNVSSVTCSGDLNIAVSTGDISINDVSCKNFRSDGRTGDMRMIDLTAEGLIQIERSTGNVVFEGCDAGELLVETDTGDVTGSLRSAKVFVTETDTGDIRVPETTSGGKCKIKTDTGDIIIEIH